MSATPVPESNNLDLKTKRRQMWASGDYPAMVERFLLPLGPRLVRAAGIGAGHRVLEVTAFPRPGDFAAHFTASYGPTITTRAHARSRGQLDDLDAALEELMTTWNRGTDGEARFEMEYLLAIGTRS